MKVGMIGLGKMGGNMATRLRRAGHEVVGFDPPQRRVRRSARWPSWSSALAPGPGWRGRWSPPAIPPRRRSRAGRPARRRATSSIDGGNSNWRDSVRRGEALAAQGHRLRRLRHQRRRLGPGRGLLPDGRRRRRVRRHLPAAVRRPGAGGGRVRPRRQGRHRATSRRWSTTASSTGSCSPTPRATSCWPARASTSTWWARSTPGGGARSCGPGCSTCWSRRCEETPDLAGIARRRHRLGRGPLDRAGGHRAGRRRPRPSAPRSTPGSSPSRTTRWP